MAPKKVNFRQIRGSWIAVAATERAASMVGHSRLPVLRDFDNGDFSWSGSSVSVKVTVDTSKDEKHPAWWMKEKNAEWRDLLESGSPVLIRKGTGADTGFGENSVGRKVGIFATDVIKITPTSLELTFSKRLCFILE